jgi:hypothetical protein
LANRLSAIAAYRPRIQLGNTVQKVELARYLADRTGLNEGSVELVIKELRDAILFFNRAGRAVKIEGLGTYTPGIDLEGTFGKSPDDLIVMWNQAHPDDPMT